MSEPYYQDEYVTLYHGNCLGALADVWVDADVLVTDPPYGMNFQSGRRKGTKLEKIYGDDDTTVRDLAVAEWAPSDKPALVFGRWNINPPAGERQRLIWHKASTAGMGDLRIPWGTNYEVIHLLGHGWDRELTGVKRTGGVITTHEARGSMGGEENKTGHPTPKPVPLMEHLVKRCPPGVVADPFAGSGATLRAAKNLGRHAVGVELEERYCEIIAQRLAQETLIF